MAFSDDNFDRLEMQMLYNFAEQRGLTKEQLNEILLNPSHDTAIPESVEARVEYLYDLAVMIWADEVVTEDEYVTLKKYCQKFEFLEENITELTDYLLEAAKKKLPKEKIIQAINS
ncbi:hypothetical protein [uncultured Marixanthomonas sp.]|uniref:hypothetical protein n=1 Tax=uncultured Marixanthomonas sp. TaxID=757245 RepID=UPI0030D939F1